jgi:uncharacterized membrane protein
MIPLFILIAFIVLFRCFGFLGVEVFSTFRESTRFALFVMFLFTASSHFTKTKEDFVKMVPSVFPFPRQIIFITGIFEILGAIGIIIIGLRSIAGVCLIILLVAMFPANYNAAKNKIMFREKLPTPLWLRLPIQIIFIALLWWTTQY